MLSRLILLARPAGVALGAFILLNVALALHTPGLAVTSAWLDVGLEEPWLSLFAWILGAALLVPDGAAAFSAARNVLGGIFAAFWILTVDGTVSFLLAWHAGRISTDFPLPLSLLVLGIVSVEFLRVFLGAPPSPRTPAPARVFLRAVFASAWFLVIAVFHVVSFGRVDHRRPADAAVVLGAKVYADGAPCDALMDRLETALDLYRSGWTERLILTGAIDPNGQSEPRVMERYLLDRGVPPARIIVDEGGANTGASARGVRQIGEDLGLRSFLAVTQYFHCARVQLAFEREGLECHTVPTCSPRSEGAPASLRLAREGFFLFREAVAYPFYLICPR